jgi:hypothetical protein
MVETVLVEIRNISGLLFLLLLLVALNRLDQPRP